MEPLGLMAAFAFGAGACRLGMGSYRSKKEASRLEAVEKAEWDLRRDLTKQIQELDVRLEAKDFAAEKRHQQQERALHKCENLFDLRLEQQKANAEQQLQAIKKGLDLRFERLKPDTEQQLQAIKKDLEKEMRAWDGRAMSLDEGLFRVDQQLQEMQAFIVKTAEEANERRLAIQETAMPQTAMPQRGMDVEEMMKLMAQLPAQQEEFSRRRAAAAANFRQPARAEGEL